MKTIDNLMRKALSENVFPGAVLLVSQNETLMFFEAYGHANRLTHRVMTRDTVFDLASLTKPLATTLGIFRLIEEKRLTLSCTLSGILPPFRESEKATITIGRLLSHSSGYPAYRPYYKTLMALSPETRVAALRDLLVREALAYSPGRAAVYSDLGFMVLRWVVETLAAERLDRFLVKNTYSPLGLADLFFIDLYSPRPLLRPFAATERCPWRKRLIEGAVHDDNAFAVGGIEGHAGLFGTARAVFHLLGLLLAAYRWPGKAHPFAHGLVEQFFSRQPGSDRALGCDMQARTGSSRGR